MQSVDAMLAERVDYRALTHRTGTVLCLLTASSLVPLSTPKLLDLQRQLQQQIATLSQSVSSNAKLTCQMQMRSRMTHLRTHACVFG
jgi:hypothetical protein